MDTLEKILFGVLFWAGIFGAWMRTRQKTLVLKAFELNATPAANDAPVVRIVGRSPGFISFLMSKFGLDDITELVISRSQVSCKSASLSGETTGFIPISKIASVNSSAVKPIWTIIAAIIVFISGMGIGFYMMSGKPGNPGGIVLIMTALLSLVLVAAYYLTKSIELSVVSDGSTHLTVRFRPSIIEGVKVDIQRSISAANVIRDLVLTGTGSHAVPASRTSSLVDVVSHAPVAPQSSVVMPSQEMRRAGVPPLAVTPAQERDALELLKKAAEAYRQGDQARGVAEMQRIIEHYPNTNAAQKAMELLRQVTK